MIYRIIVGLLILSSLSGCACMQRIFRPEHTLQQQRVKREALNRHHRQTLRNDYRSASVLQTDLTKQSTKRSYILSNGEHYKG